MANIRGLLGLAKRLKEIKGEFLTASEDVMKQTAARALQVAVFATRFDTGRAKGGWVITLGNVPADVEDRPEDKNGGPTISEGNDEIVKFKIQEGSITLANNVEYIIYLDQGSPTNEPDNMTAEALQAALDFLRQKQLEL